MGEKKKKSLPVRFVLSLVKISILFVVICGGIWFFVAKPMVKETATNKTLLKANAQRMEDVVKLLSERFHPRSYKDRVALLASAKQVEKHFKASGAKIWYQKFKVEGQEYFNVSGLYGEGKGKRIIVGAHYDSHDMTPGADDNASGVADLIELAYMLGATKDLPCEVELVAYTLEEPPYFGTEQMGSYAHAEHVKREGVDVLGVLVLEMIGYFTDEPDSQDYPNALLKLMYPSVGNFIAVVGKMDQGPFTEKVKSAFMGIEGLPVQSINAPPSIPGIDFSDHRNYWAMNYQSVMITDTAFYRNKEYHTHLDTYDRLNYQKMALVVEGTYRAIMTLAK